MLALSLIQTTTNMEDSDSESGETEASTENGIILVSGDLFNYDFIIKQYEQQLDEKISDPVFRSKIHLVNMDDFILGLVLASEKLK